MERQTDQLKDAPRKVLLEALGRAEDVLDKQHAFIERVRTQPCGVGTVHAVNADHILLLSGGGLIRIQKPADIAVSPGMHVVCNLESMQIIDVAELIPTGDTEIVSRIVDDKVVAISGGAEGNERLILRGTEALEEGDAVLLDRSGSIVISKVAQSHKVVKPSKRVTFDDIGGMTETKAQIREAIEFPLTDPELYAFYGKKPTAGILLYSAPGCGKTMLGKAIATTIADIFQKKGASEEAAASAFIYVKSTELLNKFLGQSEANIRAVFAQAKKHKAKFGFPAVLFFDEADAIMGRRGDDTMNPVGRTIVPTFLTEMDGLEDSSAIVVLATNRPDTLDPAIVRDGRIDIKIKVQRPDEAAVADIMALALKNCPLQKGLDAKTLAERVAMNLFSPKHVLHQVKVQGRSVSVPFSALASGALAVGIIEAGIGIALHRDLEAKTRTGACEADFIQAIEASLASNSQLANTDAVNEYLADQAMAPRLMAAE